MIFFWLWKNSCLTVWSRRNPKPFNFIKDYYLSKQSYVKKDILIWTCRPQNVNIIWILCWVAAKFNEKIATMLSCKLAIKANENITITEMEYLINDLRKCDNPFNCPHGRPTVIFYSNYDLEKLFKRSGF